MQHTRFLCPQDSPDKNTGVGCQFLLQFLLNSGIEPAGPVLQGDSLLLSHQENSSTNIPVNNYSKLKWTKFSNQKTLAEQVKSKTHLCVAYERHFRLHRLTMKRLKKYSMQKETKRKLELVYLYQKINFFLTFLNGQRIYFFNLNLFILIGG